MKELTNFFDEGFGWTCRRCVGPEAPETSAEHLMPRYFREGEGEAAKAGLSTQGLAKWADTTRKVLICPSCGATERIDNA